MPSGEQAGAAPHGRPGTLCITLDNMGSAADVGRGLRFTPDPDEPGFRIGYPRMLDMLADLGIRATFFVEGWAALHHPHKVTELAERGHEVGVHGWVHEKFGDLDLGNAERVLSDALAAFRLVGLAPSGFRAPYGRRGPHGIALLERMGFAFDSSLGAADDPMAPVCRIARSPGGLALLPWSYPMIDNYHFATERPDRPSPARSPAELVSFWCALLDRAAERGDLVTLIVHPQISGIDPARTAAVAQVLAYALDHPALDVLNAGAVAERPPEPGEQLCAA
jgi:peptidoglycan/xylan/chitin deacetylase (PgdA/CDA1 family)